MTFALSFRRRVQRIAARLGLLSLAVRIAVAIELRRVARRFGLRVTSGPGRTITLFAPSTAEHPPRAIRVAAYHAPYAIAAASQFDFYHASVEPTIENGVSVVDFSSSRIQRLRPSGDEYRFTGFPESEGAVDAYLAHARLKPGDMVMDVGAYCGSSVVAFARAVGPNGHVVAFECDPNALAALRENLTRHHVTNVTVIPVAVWRETTTLSFAAEGNLGSAVAELLPRAETLTHVPALSLSDAIAQAREAAGDRPVAFLKMDIEGAEVPVLEGGLSTLRRERPRIVIEPHQASDGTGARSLNTERVQALLTTAGYHSTLGGQGGEDWPLVFAVPL